MPIKLKDDKQFKRLTKQNPMLTLSLKEAKEILLCLTKSRLLKSIKPKIRKKLLDFATNYYERKKNNHCYKIRGEDY